MAGRAHVIDLSDADFPTRVATGVTLVHVCAPWSAVCHAEQRVLGAIAEAMGGRAVIASIDAERSRLPPRLGIRAVPTVLVFKDGQEVERLVGAQRRDDLLAALERHLGKPGA